MWAKRLGQGQAVGGGEEVANVIRRMRLPRAPSSVRPERIFKEKGNWHLQGMGHLLESAGADAIRSLLVLLYLLEGQTERSAEFSLAH
jgi:hypothetical protein